MVDARRKKPRAQFTLEPEERELADELAKARGVSVSRLLGELVRAAGRERPPCVGDF